MTEQPIVTPSVLDSTNFKEFFLLHDGLNHIQQELAFSIFKRYTCKAGCKMCYLKNDWIADDQFGIFVPKQITSDVATAMTRFFGAFRAVGTYDDLALLKRKYPHLYEFYVHNSPSMVNTSMTDTAFIQQFPLLMSELHFSGVYEITFSDIFLSKKRGTFVNDIVDMIKDLNKRSPLTKLKIIRCLPNGETSTVIKTLVDFAHSMNVPVGVHDDIIAGANNTLSTNVVDYQERNYYAEASEPMQVLSEIVYLQYTGTYMTLTDTVTADAAPFYDIQFLEFEQFLVASLEAKKAVYRRYCAKITQRTDNKMLDYFTYVANHLRINKRYNFIPALILKPWHNMYQTLQDCGWLETPHGLYKTGVSDRIIPIFTLSDTPLPTQIVVQHEHDKI